MNMSDESNISKKYFDLTIIFFLIISVLLLSLFILSIQDVLSPLIIFALLVLITYPQRKNLFINSIFRASILLFVLWILIKLGSVLTPFIVALFLAYIFNPLVLRLQERKLSRGLSIAIIFVIMIGLAVAVFMLIIPNLIEQIGILINQLPALAQNIQFWMEHNLVDFLESVGIPRSNLESFFKENLLPKIETTLNAIFTGLLSLIGNVGIILNQIVNLFIIPILTFYFLKDFEKIKNTILNLFHPDNHSKVVNIATEIDKILGNY
ncbi:MAG: AI-2E family transporter, partial [Ignavibacteria bacterium]|nr:AI-2E family transporter [Ignavibacteria bacterium]